MSRQIISIAEVVCSLYNNGNCDINEVIERNKGIFIDMDGACRWVFSDDSVFIIDENNMGSFLKIEKEPVAEPEQKQLPWYKRIFQEKKTIGLAVAGGVAIATAGAATVLYFHKH